MVDSINSADVIVVGGGNAALCAALNAANNGARVLLLERAPQAERGGNSVYTDGLMRVVYDSADDIRALAPDLTDEEMAVSDFGAYTEADFFDDMARITQFRSDPDLCEILVKKSRETLRWMRDQGVRFLPNFGRQAYKVDGRFKFWGGATIAVARPSAQGSGSSTTHGCATSSPTTTPWWAFA
jgi:tricarballylate dehydrogenase